MKILKNIACTIMLFAATTNGFTQSYDIKLPYDGSPITRDITFRSFCGAVGQIVVPIEFKRNRSDNTFTMTFKPTRSNSGFICLFGGDFSMRAVENARHDISFGRRIRGCDNGRVRRYYDNPGPEALQAIDVVRCIDLNWENFTINFNQPAWNGTFYAYVAIGGRGNSHEIQYLARIHFNISVGESPCENQIVQQTIRKLNERNNELRGRAAAISRELHRLLHITCEDYRSESANLRPKNRKSRDDFSYTCDLCPSCSDFTDAKNNLHHTIAGYNDTVDLYNLLLQHLEEKFRNPCPRPTVVIAVAPPPTCRCDCAKLRTTFQSIRQLVIELQTGQRSRDEVERQFRNLPDSFCSCRANDCESCQRCGSDYQAYREAHRRLSELLK